jgi:hypothetical protein
VEAQKYPDCIYDEKNHYILGELFIWEILQGKPEINFKGIYPLIEEFMILKKYA